LTVNSDKKWDRQLIEAQDSLLREATRKLGLIKGELETYNKRSKREQKQTAWITVELIQKIMDGVY